MKTDRTKLENRMKTYLTGIALQNNEAEVAQLRERLKAKHNYPADKTMDIIFRTSDLSLVSDSELFFLLEDFQPKELTTFFSDTEIGEYTKMKYKSEKKIRFPLRIPAMKVADDQWVAAIDSTFLTNLGRQSLINYNFNTQRVAMKKEKKGEVTYEIALNKTAVKQIADLMREGNFIPNGITLNMSDLSDADYYYDSEAKELVIRSIKMFDIIDGYHRFVAITQNYNKDKDFVQPMTLNIVAFSEDKAKKFIWQQDQQTKMKKMDSNSMNADAPENFITTRLNENAGFNFHNCIGSTNGSLMNYSEFAAIVKRIWFTGQNISKDEQRVYRLKVMNLIKAHLNTISDEYPDLLMHTFTTRELYVLILSSAYPEDIAEKILDFEAINKLKIFGIESSKTLAIMKDYLGSVQR